MSPRYLPRFYPYHWPRLGRPVFLLHFYEQLSFNCQEGVNDRVIFRKGTVLWIGFAFLMLGFVEIAMRDDGSVSLTRLLVS